MGLAKGHKANFARRCSHWSIRQLAKQLELVGKTSGKGRIIVAELRRREAAKVEHDNAGLMRTLRA